MPVNIVPEVDKSRAVDPGGIINYRYGDLIKEPDPFLSAGIHGCPDLAFIPSRLIFKKVLSEFKGLAQANAAVAESAVLLIE